MVKIVRNKPTGAQTAAIRAFGAAADDVPASETRPAEPPARRRDSSQAQPPRISLLRWDGNEQLRDELLEYARRERYPTHTVLIEALHRGIRDMNAS